MLSYILTIFSIISPITGAITGSNIGGYIVFNSQRDLDKLRVKLVKIKWILI